MACTSEPKLMMPGSQLMPFPTLLNLANEQLIVFGTNADERYGFGKMATIDTRALGTELAAKKLDEPLNYSRLVKSEILIPSFAAASTVNQDLFFIAKANGSLNVMPLTNQGLFSCRFEQKSLKDCPQAKAIKLPDYDPLTFFIEDQHILFSYWDSSYVDVALYQNGNLSWQNKIDLAQLISKKFNLSLSQHEIVIAKKIVKDAKNNIIYFLAERRVRPKISAQRIPNGVFLLGINVADLYREKIEDAHDSSLNLGQSFNIVGADDFAFGDMGQVLVLASKPAAIFKINMANNTLIESSTVCRMAANMSVSLTNNQIVLPCFQENKLASFTITPLAPDISSGIYGQAPAFTLIDESKNYVYASYFVDGRVLVFDLKLNYLGHVFKKTPLNGADF